MLAQRVPQRCERRRVVGIIQKCGQGLRLSLAHSPADPPGVAHPQRGHRSSEDEGLDQRKPGRIGARTGPRSRTADLGSTDRRSGSSSAPPPRTAPIAAPVRAGGGGSRGGRGGRVGRGCLAARTIRPCPAGGRLAPARTGCLALVPPSVRSGVATAGIGPATAEPTTAELVVEVAVAGIGIGIIAMVGIATTVLGDMITAVYRAAALGVGRADDQADDLIH